MLVASQVRARSVQTSTAQIDEPDVPDRICGDQVVLLEIPGDHMAG